MRIFPSVATILATLACALSAKAASFENGLDSMWVDTPQGRFECQLNKDTDYLEVLRLAGRVIFREQRRPDGIRESGTILEGIEQRGVGCPTVVAVHKGYVVIVRDVAPPDYGAQGYAVIDFNRSEPSLTRLATGQRQRDDQIPASRRLEWSEDSLMLQAFGYAENEQCCTRHAPKPRLLKVRYSFENRAVEVVK